MEGVSDRGRNGLCQLFKLTVCHKRIEAVYHKACAILCHIDGMREKCIVTDQCVHLTVAQRPSHFLGLLRAQLRNGGSYTVGQYLSDRQRIGIIVHNIVAHVHMRMRHQHIVKLLGGFGQHTQRVVRSEILCFGSADHLNTAGVGRNTFLLLEAIAYHLVFIPARCAGHLFVPQVV